MFAQLEKMNVSFAVVAVNYATLSVNCHFSDLYHLATAAEWNPDIRAAKILVGV